MQINDTARRILVAYVRSRLDDAKPVLSEAELADMAGLSGGAAAVGGSLLAIGKWCTANGLPNIATAVISAANAEHNVMLPADDIVSEYGGEGAVRAEQARVRDFDWSHWVEA